MAPPATGRSRLVPASLSIFKLRYTSRTSHKDPKFPCTKGRCLRGPPFDTLRPGLPSARLDDSHNDTDPFNTKVAYRCALCIGVPETRLNSLPNPAQMRPTAPGMASSMNSLTRAYLEPLGSLKLVFSAGFGPVNGRKPP